MAHRRCGERLGNDFECNKKIFWKEVKRVRKGELARDEMVKDGVELRRRWAEYFEQVLNVTDVNEANINVDGNRQMPVLEDLKERGISLKKEGGTVNEMKSGLKNIKKGGMAGLDGFPMECLKKGGMAVLEC